MDLFNCFDAIHSNPTVNKEKLLLEFEISKCYTDFSQKQGGTPSQNIFVVYIASVRYSNIFVIGGNNA